MVKDAAGGRLEGLVSERVQTAAIAGVTISLKDLDTMRSAVNRRERAATLCFSMSGDTRGGRRSSLPYPRAIDIAVSQTSLGEHRAYAGPR